MTSPSECQLISESGSLLDDLHSSSTVSPGFDGLGLPLITTLEGGTEISTFKNYSTILLEVSI